MPNPFSLARSLYVETSDPALRAEIQSHTGSDVATASILRSIVRFGGDPSIERFDVSPRQRGRPHPTANPVTWSVRAWRGDEPAAEVG